MLLNMNKATKNNQRSKQNFEQIMQSLTAYKRTFLFTENVIPLNLESFYRPLCRFQQAHFHF